MDRRFGRFLRWFFRWDISGLDRVPQGPLLLVGNHSGGIWFVDAILLLLAWRRQFGGRRRLFFLAHDMLMDRLGWVERICTSLDFVRATPENARRLLEQGEAVMVFPGGDWETYRPWWRRNQIDFGGRRGYVRLARATGVPIVPVAHIGAQETTLVLCRGALLARWLRLSRWFRARVFPVALCFPWGISLGGVLPPPLPLPSQLTTWVLPPLGPEKICRGDEAQAASLVEGELQAAMDLLAAQRRLPIVPDLVDWLFKRSSEGGAPSL